MAEWTDNQRLYCYYVLSVVESNCDYGASASGVISIGIVQWYGTRAGNLLVRVRDDCPDSFSVLSTRIQDAVNSDSTDWSRFSFINDDEQSWKNSTDVEGASEVQDAQFFEDLTGYLETLEYWGVNTDNVKQTIYYISMYHQSPSGCLRIIQNYGGDRSIQDLYAAAMNSSVFSGYRNRYQTVLNLLEGWDGESAPEDFDASVGGDAAQEPGGSGSTSDLESAVAYIQLVGNDLIVFGQGMSSTDRLVCHYNGNDIWIPVSSTIIENPSTGTDPGAGGAGDNPDAPEDFAAMQAIWEQYASQFSYGNGDGRLNPLSSGYSDCSACIWWAANLASGNKYTWLGTRTWTMVDTATYVRDLSFTSTEDISDWVPGDLIIMNYASGSSYAGQQHVDWYWGDGVIWGAGSAPLPRQMTTDAANYYVYYNQSLPLNWLRLYRFL